MEIIAIIFAGISTLVACSALVRDFLTRKKFGELRQSQQQVQQQVVQIKEQYKNPYIDALEHLSALHLKGELSDAEYSALKENIIVDQLGIEIPPEN